MNQFTLILFFERLDYQIYGSNKIGSNWPDNFWPVAHVGLVLLGRFVQNLYLIFLSNQLNN